MKNKVLSLLIGVALSQALSSPVQAQVMNVSERPYKGYGREFIGAELGYLGGAALTGGLFVTGFLLAWGESPLGIPVLVASLGAAIATPVISGYLIHRFGKKYNPDGKARYAILGVYSGLALMGGAAYLLTLGNQNDSDPEAFGFFTTATSLLGSLVPGIMGVFFYNYFPRHHSGEPSFSLLSKTKSGFSPGFPSLSIAPYPNGTGKFYTQISLLSISF